MKAQEVFDCMYTRPYAEDDYTLNDFIGYALRRVSWRLWERQEEICYMINEKNPPMLKDNVIDVMREEFRRSFSWVMDYMICRMLIEYRMANIDLGEEAEWYLREAFDEEQWEELNKALNAYIWNDYKKFFGAEKAAEYFKKIGRPEYILEDDNIE